MIVRRSGIQFWLLTSLLMVSPPSLRGDETDLLRYLPGDETNFIAVLHVRDLHDAVADSRVATIGTAPKWLDRLVIGSQVRIGHGERVHSYFLAEHPQGITTSFVAKQRDGLPDRIGPHSAFLCAPGDYLIELGPRQFGLVRPGVRQEVVNWIGAVDRNELAPLPDALQAEASREGELVVALDLTNSISEAHAKVWLESHEAFAGQKSKIARLANLAASSSVASAVITLANEPQIEFRLAFSGDINVEPADLVQAIREAIAERGASLPELDAAEPEIEGNVLVLRAPVGAESIRKVLSFVLTPRGISTVAPDTAEQAKSSAKEAVRQYLTSVNKIIGDLEKANRRATDYLRTAAWHENFANQIDELSVVGVPSVFVEYGYGTANRLRALAASLRGQAVTVDAEARTVTYNVQSNPGYVGVGLWGGWAVQQGNVQVTSNAAEVRQRLATAVAAGAREREQIWQLQAEDRQRVTQNFVTEFGEEP